jgi:hypothetical protein
MRKVTASDDDRDLSGLVAAARDEDAAVATLQEGFERLRRARAAQSQLATLPAEQLRKLLAQRRADLGGGQ